MFSVSGFSHAGRCIVVYRCSLICTSLVTNDVKYFLMCLLARHCFKCFMLFVPYSIGTDSLEGDFLHKEGN